MSEPLIENAELEPSGGLAGLQRKAWIVGAVGLAATGLGFAMEGESVTFYGAYLVAWLWTLSIALGLFALSMLSHISGGDWGVVMRRILEASGRTLPFFVVAGLPLVFGIDELYKWSQPAYVAKDVLIQHKTPYLNVPFFLTRAAIYFAVFSFLAYRLSALSFQQDAGDPRAKFKMKWLSCFGIIFYVLASTLASVDWIMSLEAHWFSSLFGLAFIAGHALSAFAFAVPMMIFLSAHQPFSGLIKTKLFHDYGKFILASVMVWAYFMMSQYLIIWSANIPEGIFWYIYRSTHGWQALSVFLIVGHFLVPFPLLLSADLKKRARWLATVAIWLLAMRWLDLYWQVAPSLSEHATFHWVNLVVPFGLGGIWLALLLGQLKGRKAVPVRDPGLEGVLSHG